MRGLITNKKSSEVKMSTRNRLGGVTKNTLFI